MLSSAQPYPKRSNRGCLTGWGGFSPGQAPIAYRIRPYSHIERTGLRRLSFCPQVVPNSRPRAQIAPKREDFERGIRRNAFRNHPPVDTRGNAGAPDLTIIQRYRPPTSGEWGNDMPGHISLFFLIACSPPTPRSGRQMIPERCWVVCSSRSGTGRRPSPGSMHLARTAAARTAAPARASAAKHARHIGGHPLGVNPSELRCTRKPTKPTGGSSVKG
jgi:hypothetical protein